MQPPPAEIAAALFDNATRPLDFLRHSTFGFRHFGASQMAPFETRPADAFLLLSDSPRDRSRAARSIAPTFHKAAADFGELFQIIQIAVTRAGSVGRSARPPRSGVPI